MSEVKKKFRTGFDEFINVTDELPYWSAPFGIKLLDKVILKKNIKALDIGFGTGFPLTELALRLGDTCKVIGIDPWEEAIKRTKEKINAYEITNIEIINGVAEDISLNDKSVDLITSNNGINNVSDIKKSLNECYRVLKPGGQIVLTFNLDDSMKEFYNVMQEILLKKEMNEEINNLKVHIYEKRKPLYEIKEILSNTGFKLFEIEHDKFEYKFTDGTAMFKHFFIRKAFLESWKSLVKEEDEKKIFSEIENKINKKAEQEGYFKLSVPFVTICCFK